MERLRFLPAATLVALTVIAASFGQRSQGPVEAPAPARPIPAEYVERLQADGAAFTPDDEATKTNTDDAMRAIEAASGSFNFASEGEAAYASLGETTHVESPQLDTARRVWIVVLHDVPVPILGGVEDGPKVVPEDFYVILDAVDMGPIYGGTFDDDQ